MFRVVVAGEDHVEVSEGVPTSVQSGMLLRIGSDGLPDDGAVNGLRSCGDDHTAKSDDEL